MNLQPFRVQVGVRGEEHLTIAAGAGLWAPGSSTSLVVDLAAAGLWCPLSLGPHLGKIRAPLPPREVPGCASSFPPCYRPLPSSSSILRYHPHLSPLLNTIIDFSRCLFLFCHVTLSNHYSKPNFNVSES